MSERGTLTIVCPIEVGVRPYVYLALECDFSFDEGLNTNNGFARIN